MLAENGIYNCKMSQKKKQKQKQIPIDETKMVLEDSKRQKAATSEKFCIL